MFCSYFLISLISIRPTEYMYGGTIVPSDIGFRRGAMV